MKAAFTLVEVLLTCAIVGVLAALLIPATTRMSTYAARVKSISNLRQIGVAARLYANDHNQQLPGRPSPAEPAGTPADKWPALFCAYLNPTDPRVFLDAGDPTTNALPPANIISNIVNNTGFIYNGFDDLGVDNQPPLMVPLSRLDQPSQVVLVSVKVRGSGTFFVDLLLQPITNLLGTLNPGAFDGGSHYLFADGSVRYLQKAEYANKLWLVDKSVSVPFLLFP